MKTIVRNITGLFRFLGLLFLPRVTVRPNQGDSSSESSKYDDMLGQPSVDLLQTKPVFCPACHRLVCHTSQTPQGTEVRVGNKKLVTVGQNLSISKDGKKHQGFPLRCPMGHEVWING